MTLPRDQLELLRSEIAQRLLTSTIPARLAYVARDGTPRILATWFHWSGEEVVMPTFVKAPHVARPAARLRDLRARPDVALMIDTETTPPQVLHLRGRVSIDEVDGIAPEYALAARRYLGDEAAAAYLAQIDVPGTRMARISLRPSRVGLLDFETRLPASMSG